MAKYAKLISSPVPQTEPLDSRQTRNNAGGFVYQIDDWARLERFLVLGSSEPTYYQKAQKLTKENAACVERCYAADPVRTIASIVDISTEGRAPRNDPAIFALAIGACYKDMNTRQMALAAMPKVCRIGTHLFQFVAMCKSLGRGDGRAFKRAIANWYDDKPVDKLAYQLIKYRSRENLTHKFLLRLSHPKSDHSGKTDYKYLPKYPGGDGKPLSIGKYKLPKLEEVHVCKGARDEQSPRAALYRWACGKDYDSYKLPTLATAHIVAMKDDCSKREKIELINEYKLPWEALPTECLKDPDIWKAMLPDMGLTALIRNLGTMTELGTLKPFHSEVNLACTRLTDQDQLRKARIHPFNVLVALAVYRSGASVRGKRSWQPIPRIVDALDKAFYLAFKNVVPTGKRTLIGIDVSDSMSSPMMDSPLQVCEGAAAMAMVTMRAEKNWHVMAFDHGMRGLPISAGSSLADVLQHTRNINGGGTDCALPMLTALKNNWEVDVFQVLTDNETWRGHVHPIAALREYRRKTGINAKLVVVGMTSQGFTIADPQDGGCLDVIGFDTAAPAVIADFCRGNDALHRDRPRQTPMETDDD
jgi:60 kDa SS-A/Ro ribonucleoprotein